MALNLLEDSVDKDITTLTRSELIEALEDAEDAKRLWQDLAQARAATVQRLCATVLGIDGSLVKLPGTVVTVDEVISRIADLNENRQTLGSAIFRIAELLMPVGSYADVRKHPDPAVSAVCDLRARYLSMLKLLPEDSRQSFEHSKSGLSTGATPSKPVLERPGPLYLCEGATRPAHSRTEDHVPVAASDEIL